MCECYTKLDINRDYNLYLSECNCCRKMPSCILVQALKDPSSFKPSVFSDYFITAVSITSALLMGMYTLEPNMRPKKICSWIITA